MSSPSKHYELIIALSVQASKRRCALCGDRLPTTFNNKFQAGYYCCDDYYCSIICVDSELCALGSSWKEHYTDDGECYWTEWNLLDELESEA